MTAAGKAALESASRPPIQLVTIGSGDAEIKIGNETQLYRHEEKFHRPTAVAVRISDTLDDGGARPRGRRRSASWRSSGWALRIRVNLVAVDNESGDAGALREGGEAGRGEVGPGLRVDVGQGRQPRRRRPRRSAGQRPLLYISDPAQAEAAAKVAKDENCPLAIRADGLEALAELTAKISAAGVEQIVLDPGHAGPEGDARGPDQDPPAVAEELPPAGLPDDRLHHRRRSDHAGGRGEHATWPSTPAWW